MARAAAKTKGGSSASARDTVVALLRAADKVRRRAAKVVEPHGITLQQYNVLRILENATEDGVPTLEVAARMIEGTPAITGLMDRLEAKAYIRRQRCPQDRRQHLCWLTSDGARLLARLTPVMLTTHERVLQNLDGTERQDLIALLDQVGLEE
jgi:DNA-binding MarR family transcriptional regulator